MNRPEVARTECFASGKSRCSAPRISLISVRSRARKGQDVPTYRCVIVLYALQAATLRLTGRPLATGAAPEERETPASVLSFRRRKFRARKNGRTAGIGGTHSAGGGTRSWRSGFVDFRRGESARGI